MSDPDEDDLDDIDDDDFYLLDDPLDEAIHAWDRLEDELEGD